MLKRSRIIEAFEMLKIGITTAGNNISLLILLI